MVDLKTTLYLSENEITQRVLPTTAADQVEISDISGNTSNVKAEIEHLQTSKLNSPVAQGQFGQVLKCDETGAPQWGEFPKELPEISSAEGGRVLAIKSDVSGVEWATPPSGLPDITSAVGGQVLAIKSDVSGVEWATPPSGLPDITSAVGGQVLAIKSDVSGVEWVDQSKLPDISSATAGQVLTVNSSVSGTEWASPLRLQVIKNTIKNLPIESYVLVNSDSDSVKIISAKVDRAYFLNAIASQNNISYNQIKQVMTLQINGTAVVGETTGLSMSIISVFYTDHIYAPTDMSEILIWARIESGVLNVESLQEAMSNASMFYSILVEK